MGHWCSKILIYADQIYTVQRFFTYPKQAGGEDKRVVTHKEWFPPQY